MDRRTLHKMIDELPEDELEQTARELATRLEGKVHPAVLAAWLAEPDDEPLTDEEAEAVAQARASLRERGGILHDELKRRHKL